MGLGVSMAHLTQTLRLGTVTLAGVDWTLTAAVLVVFHGLELSFPKAVC